MGDVFTFRADPETVPGAPPPPRLRWFLTKSAQHRMMLEFPEAISMSARAQYARGDYVMLMSETLTYFRNAVRRLDIARDPIIEKYVTNLFGDNRTYIFKLNGDILFVTYEEDNTLYIATVLNWAKRESYEQAIPVLANGMEPFLTQHALTRLVQRFRPRFSRTALKAFAQGDRFEIWQEAMTIFAAADERRQIINDTEFMTYIYERYGYEKRYSFRVSGSIVFVGLEDHEANRLRVVTVIDLQSEGAYTHRNMGRRIKFNGR